jgi:hypothetical protein
MSTSPKREPSCSPMPAVSAPRDVFAHACRLGAEGVVSKRVDAPYRSGPHAAWVKTRSPATPGEWRVEYVGDDGGLVNIFVGPRAERPGAGQDHDCACGRPPLQRAIAQRFRALARLGSHGRLPWRPVSGEHSSPGGRGRTVDGRHASPASAIEASSAVPAAKLDGPRGCFRGTSFFAVSS